MAPLLLPSVRVAACHVNPVFLNTGATVKKTISLIGEAARNGADLVTFPETFLPGFPLWSALSSPNLNHDLFVQLSKQAIHVDGPEINDLKTACRENGVFAQIGFNERSRSSLGCLWNSTVLIGDRGQVLNHHRKIVPTYFEKLTWANGDGNGLRVVDTRIGRVGALICGENGNPLARYSLHAQGEQLHVSHWPPAFPTRPATESGAFNLGEATKIRVAAHCFEGKCFGVVSASPLTATRDFLIKRDPTSAALFDNMGGGTTMFIDPMGQQTGDQIVGDDEGIAYADLDLNKCIEPKQFHDFVGGYQRYDIFKLAVDRTRQKPVKWENEAWEGPAEEPSDI